MAKKRIYVDSCVLMAAFKANQPEVSDAAIEALEDPEIEILYSPITELEVMPMPTFNNRMSECEFYKNIFEVGTRVECTEQTVDAALDIAQRNGFTACDALHVACALASEADELLTIEKKTRLPNARNAGVKIRTLRP